MSREIEDPDRGFMQSPPTSYMANTKGQPQVDIPGENFTNFESSSVDEKLNMLMSGMTQIITVNQGLADSITQHEYHILHATDGLNPRLSTLQVQVDTNSSALSQIASKKEIKELKDITKDARQLTATLKHNASVAKQEDLETLKSLIKRQYEDLKADKVETSELDLLRAEVK